MDQLSKTQQEYVTNFSKSQFLVKSYNLTIQEKDIPQFLKVLSDTKSVFFFNRVFDILLEHLSKHNPITPVLLEFLIHYRIT
jgi:hypothetical protein